MVSFNYLRVLFTVIIFIAAFPSLVYSGTFTVFGPADYPRVKGKPSRVATDFSILNPNAAYTLVITSGGAGGQWSRVSSARIKLNGVVITSPQDWNQNVAIIERPIQLNSENHIEVEMRSRPGSGITLEIIGIDNDLPSIQASVTPPPNQFGWHRSDVEVAFECSDQTSGITSCPEPMIVSAEGKDIPISGTAVDRAGNEVITTVYVSLDKAPPAMGVSWPPTDEFGTDLALVEIKGFSSDDLSGVNQVIVRDQFGEDATPDSQFSYLRSLMTDIPEGEKGIDNMILLEAVDLAGNTITQSLRVRYTLVSTMAEGTDPTDYVPAADGVLTSMTQALVHFHPSVSREMIHEIIQQQGGRVGGHLTTLNITLAIFETEGLEQLDDKLASLESKSEVAKAVPVTLVDLLQYVTFDNDSLTDYERIAYDSINLRQAADIILGNELPLSPVRVAVIDSGLNADYGRNNEFTDIHFYDLCTLEGQEGQTSIPNDANSSVNFSHGSWVTGAVAGANNGEGNNGVIRGLPASAFGVSMFRAGCFSGGRLSDIRIAQAFDLIVGGTIGDFDVVNMSFGSSAARSSYEEIFTSPMGQEILWVAGAGNDGDEMSCDDGTALFYPAGFACSLDNVVSVGGYGAVSEVNGYNYGAITLSAPGSHVRTALKPGEYGFKGGTSLASPLVAGAAALAQAVNPDVSPPQIKECLTQTARPLNDPLLPEGGIDVEALIREFPTPVTYDNGPSTHTGGSAIGHFIAADDFQLPKTALVTGASVDVADSPEPGRWDGTVEWWIFSDELGHPGDVIASGIGQNVEMSNLVVSPLGFRDFAVDFDFDFGEEVALAGGGRFWLGLHFAANYEHLSVFWDHTWDVTGQPSYKGGEIFEGVPNFDGPYAGPSAYDYSFRLKTTQGACATAGLPVLESPIVEVPCPCFTADDLNVVEWDIWCSGSTFEYLLDNASSNDPAPLVDADTRSDAPSCSTGSFYNPVTHLITNIQAQACVNLIVDTGTIKGTERACRID